MLRPRRRSWFAAFLLVFVAVVPAAAQEGDAVPPVTDWRTGIALYGFDPVAFFAEARAVSGVPDHESRFAGTVWRFKSEGNRAAFAHDPEAYAPAFGGYDPVSIGRGTAMPGDPRIWLIHSRRLFLFETERSRNAFQLDPEAVLRTATDRWPGVSAQLTP